jgi:hypothetical protein
VAARLTQLIEAHTRWQKLEVRIALMLDQLTRDRLREFANLWPWTQRELTTLTSDGCDEWSDAIRAACRRLDEAVRLGDSTENIATIFQMCASGVDQRFFLLDHDLKDFCGELRYLGSGLDSLVDAAQELVGANA